MGERQAGKTGHVMALTIRRAVASGEISADFGDRLWASYCAAIGAPVPTETVLQHDPDSGCRTCPLRLAPSNGGTVGPWWCGAAPVAGPRSMFSDPAPDWCPLRAGRVVVEGGAG